MKTTPTRPRPASDRGSVTTQVVIGVPLLLTLPMLIVQFALWALATHAAQAAAAQGLDSARVSGGSAAAGQAEAQQVLAQLAGGPLTGARVTVYRDVRTATVRITGHAEPVLPWLQLPVHADATGDVETVTNP
jgi:hypothetical protein